MTNIKALEKLRELCADVKSMDFASVGCDAVLEIADEIEDEIAERYIELPVDADGVPIHCGDRMRLDNGHEGEVWLIGAQDIMMSDHICFDWARSRHVKPRTIEDVLHDFLEEWESHPIDAEWGMRLERLRESEAKYAAEIRELMGGGEMSANELTAE